MELTEALDFARTHTQSVIVTIRRDTRPQLSNVLHHVYDSGLIRISITADRAKYHNLLREPWAALHVTREDFYAYAVLEGTVELSEIAAAPDDEVVEELVEYYQSLRGEHEDWQKYRDAMVRQRRLMIRFTPSRAYGMLGRE
jgi:PPOX class probable F420-dependent enzyme